MNGLSSFEVVPEPLAGLVRDHEHVAEVIADARGVLDRAAQYGLDAERSAEVIESTRGLERFLARDLTLHIAKEEQVLFPTLRELARDTSRTVDDMVAQHDEIRARHALIEQTMAALDAHHGVIDEERVALAAGLQDAATMMSAETLATLQGAVTRLHWILQGHFGDEEDHLFAPAAVLLAPDVLEDLASRMAALERAAPPA